MADEQGTGGGTAGSSRTPGEQERLERWLPGGRKASSLPAAPRPPASRPSRPPGSPSLPERPERVSQRGTSGRPGGSWLPPVPAAAPQVSAGWEPGMQSPDAPMGTLGAAPAGGITGLTEVPVAPPGIEERRRNTLYDLVDIGAAAIDMLGGVSTAYEAGTKSRIDEWLESPTEKLAQLALNAAWKWGADLFYQLPKVPERVYWLMLERIKSIEAGTASDPFADLMMVAVSPTGRVEEDSLLEMEVEQLIGYLKEGEIGYTFAKHPERLEPFRAAVTAGMPMKEAVREYEDFWLEMGLNTLIDPAWMIPAEAVKVIWPGGIGLSKVIGAGLKGVGAVLGKIRMTEFLVRFTKKSQIAMRGAQASDAIAELVLKSPADESVVDVINQALRGDITSPLISTRTQAALEGLATLDVKNVDELLARYMPDLTPNAAKKLLEQNPGYITYLVAKATEIKAGAELSYIAASDRGAIARAYDFARGMLKEQWLSANPAYVLANSSDNTVKCWLSGHFVNPTDLNAPAKIAQYMGEWGLPVPANVAQSLVEAEMGGVGRMRNVPIPGLGKPREIVEFWNTLLGRSKGAMAPWATDLIPPRATDAAEMLGLAEPVGRVAKVLDALNYASVSEYGREVSTKVEQTARAQMFWGVFSKELDQTARPALMEAAADLPASVQAQLRRVKNPAEILGIADNLTEGATVSATRLSELMPEGAQGELYDYVAKVLDQLQDDAIAAGRPEVLIDQVDDLFGTLAERSRQMQEAAVAEEVITEWRATQVAESVEGLLLRTRELSDNLLLQVQERLGTQPDMAGSLWPRYFDTKSRLMNDVQSEVSRLVRETTPTISQKVDDVLSNLESVTPDRLAEGMGYDEWGMFGEQLAALRSFVDEGQETAWKAFLDGDHSEARLSIVEEAYEHISTVWQKAADDASVLRDGYIAQAKMGTPRISAEQYQLRMQEIWERQGFMPVQEAWSQVADLLGHVKAAAPEELGDVAQSWLKPTSIGDMEVLENFKQLQQSDPQAALKWFREQTAELQLKLQKDAQADYVRDSGRQVSERFDTDARSLMQNISDWRRQIGYQVDDLVNTRQVQATEKADLLGRLQPLARQWADALDSASQLGQARVNEILYDYTKTQNWEAGLSNLFPFTKWQLRNPFTWAKLMEQQPGAFSLATRFIRASEADRERRNLSQRFEGLMPLPGQEFLQEIGVLDKGYWGVNPNPFMSIMGQLQGDPWVTPEESEMGADTPGTIAWALKQPERVGIHLWPWLQQAAAAAGYASPPSWGAAGAPGRLSPDVQRAEEGVQGLLPGGAQDTSWLTEYWVRQSLAAMVAEGQITAEEAAAPSPELLASTQAYVEGMNARLAQLRWAIPLSLKHARPGEMQIRDLKADMREMPEAEAAFLRTQHPEIAAYNRAVGSVSEPDRATWQGKRDTINLKYDEMLQGIPPWHPRANELESARWEEIDALGEDPGGPYEGPTTPIAELVSNRPTPEQFAEDGEVDWDTYNQALDEYVANLPEDVTEEEYDQYRQRYLSPLELIWDMQKQHQAQGWEEYTRLRETPDTPEFYGWLGEGVKTRREAGWGAPDVDAWAESQDRLPYDEVQRLLGEKFGPKKVGDYLPDLLRARSWLQDSLAKEASKGIAEEGFTARPYWLRNIESTIDRIETSRETHEDLGWGEEHDTKVMEYYDEILDVLDSLEAGEEVSPKQLERALELIQENMQANERLARSDDADASAYREAMMGYQEVQDLLEQALSEDKATAMVRSSTDMRDQHYAEEWLAQQGEEVPTGMSPLEYADLLQGKELGKEWGDLEQWLDTDMPGMFTGVGAEEQLDDATREWYYSMLPNQRREAAQYIGLEQDADLDTWLERVGIAQYGEPVARSIFALFKPLTSEDRLEVEEDMIQWERGAGDWTDLLTTYYSNPDTPQARFWGELNTLILDDSAYDDPMLTAVLSKDVRGRLEYTDEQFEEFYTYLQENRDTLVDTRAMELAAEYPEEFEIAQDQAAEVRALVGPDALQSLYMSLELIGERNEWRDENPEAWEELGEHWDERSRLQVSNPYYLFFYKNDQFVEWFGEVDPEEVDIPEALAFYDQADAEMDAFTAGEGAWTASMDHWFGGGSKSEFWEYYHANKDNFDWKTMRDDNLLEAALSQGAKPYLTTRGEELMYVEALEHLRWYWKAAEAVVEEPAPKKSSGGGGKKKSGGSGSSGGGPPAPPPKPPGL